jgi:TRAP-type C4-dicarboxylate transport system permease small subunit
LKISSGMSRLDKITFKISVWLERIAIVGALGMILGTMIDVIGAKVFHWPLPGGTEVVYLFQIISIAGALAISKIDGRHVRIELIDRLHQPGKGIVHSVVALLGLALFIILVWQSYTYALSLHASHEVTATIKLPLYPFALWLALCCIPMVLLLIIELFNSLMEAIKR